MRDYEQLAVSSRSALRAWLAKNHEQSEPIWLVTAKKAAGKGYIPYDEIVEEVLCFGWIDSLPRALDDKRSMLLLSPRKAGSAWSKPNRERVARLIKAGRMHPAGLAKVVAAQTNGSWEFLKSAEDGAVPGDLAAALDTIAGARQGYESFADPVRRRILENLLRAKRPQTRTKRIAKIVAGAAAGVDPLKWTPKR